MKWTKQPPEIAYVNSGPLSGSNSGVWLPHLRGVNSVPGSRAGLLTYPTAGTHTYAVNDRIGRGLTFDNTASPAASGAGFSTADGSAGFWHEAKTELTLGVVARLDDDTFGMEILWDVGDASNGLAIGYRTSPNTLVARVVSSTGGGTDPEITAATTFVPNADLFIVVKYSGSAGTLKLWINGVLEASSTSAPTSIAAHTGYPALGDKAGATCFADTDEDEWGGLISLAFASQNVIPDEVCKQLTVNPWQIFQPKRNFAFTDVPDDTRHAVIKKPWTTQPPAGTLPDVTNALLNQSVVVLDFQSMLEPSVDDVTPANSLGIYKYNGFFPSSAAGYLENLLTLAGSWNRTIGANGLVGLFNNAAAYFNLDLFGHAYPYAGDWTAFSVVQFNDVSKDNAIWGLSDEANFQLWADTNAGSLRLGAYDGATTTYSSAGSLGDTARAYFITFTYDDSTTTLTGYIDGVEVLQDTGFSDNNTSAHLSHFSAAGTKIGDVNSYLSVVWGRVLTLGEVSALAANPWQIFKPQLIHVPIDEDLPKLAKIEVPF